MGGLAFAPAALAASPDVVINEVYGGGGNAGATLTHDFIELYNAGAQPVDLSGWSVQYASAAGTSWTPTELTGSIPAGGSYLVQEGKGGGGSVDLPAPDASGSIAVSGTAGKVALVQSSDALTCGHACTAAPGVRDFVGFGGAGEYEGSGPTGVLSNTTSASRSRGADTDDNSADFTIGAPSPTNAAGQGVDIPPLPAEDCAAPTVPIGSVQGKTRTSPDVGTTVTVAGTIVGDLRNAQQGIAIEGAPDGDDETSDGLFVYGTDLGDVAVGQSVVVTGKVSEYYGMTEVTATRLGHCGTADLPAAAPLPLPSTDAEREAYEGMLVAPAADLTVTDVYNLDNYGEIALSSGGRLLTPTEVVDPGPDATDYAERNAEREIVLDDGSAVNYSTSGGTPPHLGIDDSVRVGDQAHLEPVVLTYSYGDWMLEPADGTWQGTTFDDSNPRPTTAPHVGGDLEIADFNVLNYFVDFPSEFGDAARGAANADELARQQAKIVNAIATLDPGIATLHEIENSAVVNPASGKYHAVATLIAALEDRQGVPHGTWNYVKAREDTDVITNAIIYRTDRVTAVGDPMIPDTADLAPFSNARTPIAQTFRAGGETFSIIANHLKSKGSECATGNDTSVGGAGNCNADRVAQARALVHFADTVTQQSGDDDLLLSGDFNSYRMEDPVDVITGAGYTDMAPVLAKDEYSYVFDGASGSLDHEFASPTMKAKLTGMGIWDINAPESFGYQYDGNPKLYADYPYRASDHNPSLLGVNLPATATVSDTRPQRGDQVTVSGRFFTGGTTVTVTVPRPGHPEVLTATAGPDGTVSVPFRVHPGLRAGTYEVTLTAADGEGAGASFTVASPPVSAPGR
jgi:5'-nucleotidase